MKITDFLKAPEIQPMRTSTPSTSTNISSLYTQPQQPIKPVSNTYHLPDRGVKITDDDIEAFRPILYGEVSNRDINKKRLEADVIFNTALNRQKEHARYGKNLTISDILNNGEYQAYGGAQYKEYSAPSNPISAAKKKEVDAIVDEIKEKIKKGDYKDNTEGSFYYIHNPDNTISYNNKKKLYK